jgi:hypothetical protein
MNRRGGYLPIGVLDRQPEDGHSALVANVTCEIVRWTADEFPGWVEVELLDADGIRWSFIDKAPIFSADPLTSATSYPVPGVIRCVIVEKDESRGRTAIDTSRPDGLTATDGVTTRFSVDSDLVVP